MGVEELNHEIRVYQQGLDQVFSELEKVIVGQRKMLERLVLAMLLESHLLLEGVPGLAKTTAVKTLARIVSAKFNRVQFTPDLLPSDIIGTQVYNPKDHIFSVKHGPVFCNILLADEVNRAPAKVQSALLEAMQERQVTIGEQSFPLERPFTVLATQNPIEHEGTYPLPEAQVDRFLFKVLLDYPSADEEMEIVRRMTLEEVIGVRALLGPSQILELQKVIRRIHVDSRIDHYIINVVHATRTPKASGLAAIAPFIQYGASPRASIYLHLAAQGLAFLRGRAYVTPQDIKEIGFDVLRHRILLTYEAEAEGKVSDEILHQIFDHVEVP